MSQRVLGELVGRSQPFIARVERGTLEVDQRSTLTELARVLQIPTAALIYSDEPEFPARDAAEASMPAIRTALNVVRLGDDAPARRTVEELGKAVAELSPLWRAARYDVLCPLVPDILIDLHAQSVSGDEPTRREAHRLTIRTVRALSPALIRLGQVDLATVATDVACAAARRLDEPHWSGVAIFDRLHALPMENRDLVGRIATQAIDSISQHHLTGRGQPEVLQVIGMLHLSKALSDAVNQDRDGIDTHLTEARVLAERTGEGRFADLCFGPTNLGFWETAIAVELKEGGRVREIASRLDPQRVGSRTRMSDYYVDVGRGLAQTRRDDEKAVSYLLRAELAAPQRARLSPTARETVRAMLMRARRRAGGQELRKLAERFGAT